jgi:hypothetical protein
MRLPTAKDGVAVGVGDGLLGRADHQVGEFAAAAGKQRYFFEGAKIDVVVQEPQQVNKSLMVLVALVRRGGEQQEGIAILPVADLFGQPIVLRLFDLAGPAVIRRAQSMGLIEAGVRGALQVASETTVIDEDGRAVMGSVDTFLRKRTEGTERSDKAAPTKGVEKFWGDMPTWGMYEGTPNIDLVIVPAIDGNFDPATNELIPFERQFQFLHSLQNYFLTNELLAPGHVMPLVDNDRLRERRAGFVARFCERPFHFIRAATPQVLLDEVDKIL